MLIVEVKHSNVDKALKILRRKVKLTKQTFVLREKKHFIKNSMKKRLKLQKAIHKQQIKDLEE
ncbi:30S ribosomal protein S21 [bacterium]|jgi:ribosomal protein S21|nr:30S ribosomal protein S21 [bacterium]|tara:strand:- start:529 stop:717 length:189 start_codon:yes stop_codon:yes gene_type:complete